MKGIRGVGAAWLALALLAAVGFAMLVGGRGAWAQVLMRQGGGILAHVARIVVTPALAQEKSLQFKPVPPESATQIEKRRSTRRTDERRTEKSAEEVKALEPSEAPPAPQSPTTPATPPTPATPQVLVTRSGDVMRVASDIHVGPEEVIEGDLLSVAGDVTVEGRIEGDLVAMGGDIYLRSTAQVDGDVVAMGGELHEDDGASVGGQRVIGMGVRDGKRVTRRLRERDHDDETTAVDSIITLLILLGIGWLFSAFGANRTRAALATLAANPAASLGIGAVICALAIPSLVALVIVVALLCITIIGIPVALAALLGYLIFVCVMFLWGYLVSAAAVGGMVLRRRAQIVAVPPAPASAAPIVEGMTAAPAIPAAPGASTPAAPHDSLTRSMLMGILILSGTGTLGHILKSAGPLGGLGGFLVVISALAVLVASVVGAGAWLTSEARTGLIGRIWAGRRRGSAAAPVTPAPAAPPAGGSAV